MSATHTRAARPLRGAGLAARSACALAAAAVLAMQGGCALPLRGEGLDADAAISEAAAKAPRAWQATRPHAPSATPTASPSPAASSPAAAAPAGAPIASWAAFGDPLLLPLIEAAQGASGQLSAAAARIEAARAQRAAAGAAMQPRLDASGALARGRSTPGNPIADSASIGVQAGWELDLFGGRASARDAAARRLRSAELQWHAQRVALAAEVATSYTALRACESQSQQAALDAESRAQTARLTEQSAKAGVSAPANAALARASSAQARAQLVQQQAACDLLVNSLVALTGLAEDDLRARLASATARQPEPAGARVQTLPAALLQQRPDLAALAQLVQATAADERQAAAARLPQVSLSGSIGLMRISTGFASQDGAVWSIGPVAVSVPLFDGGRRAAERQAARAAYDDAVVQLQAALRGAVREVEDALIALASVAAREADLGVATEGFEASLRAAEARWRGGVGSLFELEDARRSALAAKSAWVELRRERATAWINLYRALGGGWVATEPASPPAASR